MSCFERFQVGMERRETKTKMKLHNKRQIKIYTQKQQSDHSTSSTEGPVLSSGPSGSAPSWGGAPAS